MRLFITLLLGALGFSQDASALTAAEFVSLCESSTGECADHPVVQAYVGGALDLVAVLDEETDYLDRIYCKSPSELFDLPSMIRFMQAQAPKHASKNAMLLLVRYLEEEGGCT